MQRELEIPFVVSVKYPSIDVTLQQYSFLRTRLAPYNAYGYGLKAAPVFSKSGNFILVVARFVCPPDELCSQIKSSLLSKGAEESYPPEEELLIILAELVRPRL